MSDRREEILSDQLGRYLLKISHISHGTDAIPHAIKLAMDEYMRETCLELLDYVAKRVSNFWIDDNGNSKFRLSGDEELTKEQLLENFL